MIIFVVVSVLQIESEENVLICLRIIIELHKQFRPPISQEVKMLVASAFRSSLNVCVVSLISFLFFLFISQIHNFLDFVKQIYKDLPKVVVR